MASGPNVFDTVIRGGTKDGLRGGLSAVANSVTIHNRMVREDMVVGPWRGGRSLLRRRRLMTMVAARRSFTATIDSLRGSLAPDCTCSFCPDRRR